jgi:hypothetical protein
MSVFPDKELVVLKMYAAFVPEFATAELKTVPDVVALALIVLVHVE